MDDCGKLSGQRAHTREALLATFNDLLLNGENERPKVADIIAQAGVGRSTFYNHFDGVAALLDESMGGLLDHVYQNRQRAHELLTGTRGDRAEAQLSRRLLARIGGHEDARLKAILIAGTTMAALEGWAAGRVSSAPDRLAAKLHRTVAAILADGGEDQA